VTVNEILPDVFPESFPALSALWTTETSSEKIIRKKFRKNLEDNQKSPYLCSRFPNETEAMNKAIFDEFT